MPDSSRPILTKSDVADLLADRFPGHTMQRMRTVDGKYRYIYVSSGVQNSFGLNPEELMKAEAVDHEWIHVDDRRRFVDALESSARDLTPLDIEVRVESPGGGYRWVRSLGHPRRETDGSVIWDGVALDVTDRREALDALERAMAEARKSEVAEGRFSYIAAQNLAVPLAALRDTVLGMEQVDTADAKAVGQAVARLAEQFSVFEKALLATRGLMMTTSAEAAQPAVSRDTLLTSRQSEILEMVRAGASNRDIAGRLGISEGTVKLHVSAILKRLGVRNRTEAAQQVM